METPDVITLCSDTEEDLQAGVEALLQQVGRLRCICFWGGLGVGKTTFIRALCKHLGVTDVVTSPTFSLINEYHCHDGAPIYHFDFYRLTSLREAMDIGVEEYFFSNTGLCLIEWPALIESLLPPETLDIAVRVAPDGVRSLAIGVRE